MRLQRGIELQRIVFGVFIPKQRPDLSAGWIEHGSRARGRRPDVTLRSGCGKHDVGVVGTKRLMNTLRAHVGSRHSKVFGHAALDIDIPLHHVTSMGMGLDINLRQRRWTQKSSSPTGETSAGQVGRSFQLVKRSRQARQKLELIGQGQYVVDSKSGSERRLTVAKWVPRKSDARLKVSIGRIRKIGAAEVRRQIREIP